MIIASAVKFTKDGKDIVIMGRRHHDCLGTAYDAGLRLPWTDVQGFVTDDFHFLDRYAAMRHAASKGQVHTGMTGALYSEDLWFGDQS